MRTLFIGTLALNLVGCIYLPNFDASAADLDSKPVASKVHPQYITKSTKPQNPSSVQFGKKTQAATRARDNVAAKKAPLSPPQFTGRAEPVIERAKASIAAMMPNPASARFHNLRRAVKKLPDESIHGICGYVKGKNASGGDTGQLPLLYIIRDDRDGEAYLVDGTNYTAQTVHSALCK